MHGGSIQAFSEGEGKGCSFVYKIPMKKNTSLSNTLTNNDAILPQPAPGDEKVDDFELRPPSSVIMIPDPSPTPPSNHNIIPASPRDVGRLHNHQRPSVVSATSSNESRNIAARRLSSFRLSHASMHSNPNHPSSLVIPGSHRESSQPPLQGGLRGPLSSSSNGSVSHVAPSNGYLGSMERDENSAFEFSREGNRGGITENILAEAQRQLIAEAASVIVSTTTGAKLQAIIEAPSAINSRYPSASNSVHDTHDIPVLPPISDDSEWHEPPSAPVKQLSSLFLNTDGIAGGGGGAGEVLVSSTIPKSVNQVIHGRGIAINDVAAEPVSAPRMPSIKIEPPISSSQRKIRITKASPPPHTATRSFHVLVVDDSPMSRKMLRRTLVAAGHTCEEAEDGSIAVAMVKAKSLSTYDAILMDFVMVGLSNLSPPPHTHTHPHPHPHPFTSPLAPSPLTHFCLLSFLLSL